MPRLNLKTLATNNANPESLLQQLRSVILDIEAQLNRQANVYSLNNNKLPVGTRRNDVIISYVRGVLKVGIYDGRRIKNLSATDLQVLQSGGTNFLGIQTGTAAPTLTLFPKPNDWGYYDRTAGAPGMYLCYHRPSSGTLSILLL